MEAESDAMDQLINSIDQHVSEMNDEESAAIAEEALMSKVIEDNPDLLEPEIDIKSDQDKEEKKETFKVPEGKLKVKTQQTTDDDDDDEMPIDQSFNQLLHEWQRPFYWDSEVNRTNTELFGNETFKECQREIINATMSKRDVLALIPTGGGKSLTFQLPSVIDKGITFVVMPLLSLIQDNLTYVQSLGLKATAFSNSTKHPEQLIEETMRGHYKLIYITPEKLVAAPRYIDMINTLYIQGKIARFVIDEVHCVSHWGQDFRKDYLALSMLREKYPKVPILGLTATATVKVKDDLI